MKPPSERLHITLTYLAEVAFGSAKRYIYFVLSLVSAGVVMLEMTV